MRFKAFSAATGAIVGSTMLASLSAGTAEAAGNDCKNIDLTRQPDVLAAFQACLGGAKLAPADAVINKEIENRGCAVVYNRSTKANDTICMVVIPRDRSCPPDTTSMSRISNLFDPKNTVDGRKVGTTRCEFRGVQPAAAPQ